MKSYIIQKRITTAKNDGTPVFSGQYPPMSEFLWGEPGRILEIHPYTKILDSRKQKLLTKIITCTGVYNCNNRSLSMAQEVQLSTSEMETTGHSPRQPIPALLQYKPFTRFQLWVYDLFLWMFTVIFDCFFREIRPRGAFRLPKLGPVIFVAAPHANQFVDPIILMNQVRKEANRRISFLIATKSYKHPVIGPLSRMQLSIPVSRAQDMLVSGTGKITVDFNQDCLLVRGKGTKFTEECMVRGLIALPKSLGASEIAEIRSDTELVIKKEFKRSDKIIELLRKGTPFKVADKIDQKQVYDFVFNHLSNGNCLGIFPEGGSHDRTDMLPLKAGVAVMALGAMSNDPNCNVKIVPCGMNYFNAHKFRSRAVIEFGHPIEITQDLVKKYNSPETNRESVKELLDTITTGLRAVTVNCQDYETLMVVQAARRLYAGNFAQYLPLPMVVEMNRRLVLGYETFKDRRDMQELKKKILRYNDYLKLMYLPDHHVEDCDETHKLHLIPIFLSRIIRLIFFFILALPGAVLFSPVFMLSKYVSLKKKKTALANSTVKIKANDVVATWKILISMGAAPLLYSLYASLGTWYCKHHNYLSSFGLVSMWFVLYALGVLVTYSALITGEQGVDLMKSIRPLYLSIFDGSSIAELKQLRKELSEEITEVVNTYGIELFPDDFNLLDVKDSDSGKESQYVDTDEEEEMKTQELKNRRKARKNNQRAKGLANSKEEGGGLTPVSVNSESELSLSDYLSSSLDGISLNSNSSSYTNIPLFSDYDLHANAKNSQIDIASVVPSALASTISMADDFNHRGPSTPDKTLSRDNSQMELNFDSKVDFSKLRNPNSSDGIRHRSKLSEKIKNKVMESRDLNQ